MSDDTNAPVRTSKASLLIPCVTLALTVAAMAIGAPARIARLSSPPAAVLAALEFDPSIRYEPVVYADLSDHRLVAAHRLLDQLTSRQLIAFR